MGLKYASGHTLDQAWHSFSQLLFETVDLKDFFYSPNATKQHFNLETVGFVRTCTLLLPLIIIIHILSYNSDQDHCYDVGICGNGNSNAIYRRSKMSQWGRTFN